MTDPVDIFAWRRIDDRVTTSGQPSEAQLGALADLGVTDIVNLGLHSHERALADEPACVAALGMAYHYIPVAFDDPRPEDYTAFRDRMRALGDRMVHVHCIANLRVSAFLFRYRLEFAGFSHEQARTELEHVWKPGGVWAAFVGDEVGQILPHRYAGREY